jgi:hypothetical protein
MNKRLTQMNERLKGSKQTLNEGKEGMKETIKCGGRNFLI